MPLGQVGVDGRPAWLCCEAMNQLGRGAISSRTRFDDHARPRRHRLCSRRACREFMAFTQRSSRFLAYALFGPSRSWCLGRIHRWPPSSSASCSAFGRRSVRAVALASIWRSSLAPILILPGCAAWFRHRAPIETDPLWLHERHRVDGVDQPATEAFGFSIDAEGPCGSLGHRQSGRGRDERTGWLSRSVRLSA